MKNNRAIVLFKEKVIVFRFCDEVFAIDLAEGDLEDSWNSITTWDGNVYDTNFCLEEPKDKPSFTIYECNLGEDGLLHVEMGEYHEIKIVKQIGTKTQYFK